MSPDALNILIVSSLVVAAAGLWSAMPQRRHGLRGVAAGVAAGALLLIIGCFQITPDDLTQQVLFWFFTASTVLCAVLMITCRAPVNGALWFALSTLSVCGLFLELSAPFLAAATTIVYAGAIIVTFMFVIMLAQQSGTRSYDQYASHPTAALLVSMLLLGTLVMSLLQWRTDTELAAKDSPRPQVTSSVAHPYSVATEAAPQGSLHALGRTLFGDYLFAIEIAGSVLLIATVGAILLVPRRSQGTL